MDQSEYLRGPDASSNRLVTFFYMFFNDEKNQGSMLIEVDVMNKNAKYNANVEGMLCNKNQQLHRIPVSRTLKAMVEASLKVWAAF